MCASLLPMALAAVVVFFRGASAVPPAAPAFAASNGDAAKQQCRPGLRHAVVAGTERCLGRGQRCARRHDQRYHRYGFHCHARRLTRAPFRGVSDLALGLGAPLEVRAGERMTYGIDVRNEGPDIARWVSVSLALSTSLELRSVQTGPHRDPTRSTGCLLGGSLRRPLAHCTFDAVGSGGAFTLTVVAVSRTPGRVVAMAAVDSATRDPAKDDNSASAVTTVVTG